VATLADTSGLIAAADATQAQHTAVAEFIDSTPEILLVPITVLPEVDYMLTRRVGAHVSLAVLRSIADGALRLEGLSTDDFARSLQLIERYADSNIGFVDASIVAIAERLRIARILTLDRRHFGMVRPKHCPAFELVP
jgi:uncharacterized protein